jgi:histidyl-tRNA synthetase
VLRPEGTAAVARAVLADPARAAALRTVGGASKLWYCGPFFRRERPQRGRYRQFEQFGVELLGCGSVLDDVECVAMAADALGALGVLPRLELRLNSLGDAASRRAFAQALREHLHSLGARADIALSPESQQRLEAGGDTAVLRILDSKHPADVAALARGGSEGTMGGAAGSSSPSPSCPALSDFLTPEASERMQRVFEGVTSSLPPERLRVVQDDRLVRGLDYYCHTAFEFVVREEQGEEDHEEGFGGGGNNNNNNNNSGSSSTRALGLGAQQGTVLAGGRYDGLLGSLGYKHGGDIPGIGWAAGIDRLKLLMEEGEQRGQRAPPTPDGSGSGSGSGIATPNPVLEAARRRAAAAVVAVLPLAAAGADEMSPAVERAVLDVSARLRAGLSARGTEAGRGGGGGGGGADRLFASPRVCTQHAAGKLKKKIRAANAQGAGVCVIVGDAEAEDGVCAVRDMRTRVQEDVPVEDVARRVAEILQGQQH